MEIRDIGIKGTDQLESQHARRRNERLRRSINSHVWRCGYTPPDHSISVAVEDGTVYLEGTVRDIADVRVVASLISMLDGVLTVVNHLAPRSAGRWIAG